MIASLAGVGGQLSLLVPQNLENFRLDNELMKNLVVFLGVTPRNATGNT